MAGASEVVKVNPGAKERKAPQHSRLAAIYPPITPYPLARVPLTMSILCACCSRAAIPLPPGP